MNKKTELTDIIDKFFQNIPPEYLNFIKNSDIADEGKIGYKEWLENRQKLIDSYKATFIDKTEYDPTRIIPSKFLGLTDLFDINHPNYLFFKQQKYIAHLKEEYPNYQQYQDELLKLYLGDHKAHIKYKNIYECCKFDTTTANKENVHIMRNGIMGCSEDRLKDALNTNDLSDFDGFFVQQLSKLQEAIKDMHQDGYCIGKIQNNAIYLNKERTEYLDFDIMFMLLNPDELIDCYEQEMDLKKDKKPLVGSEYNYRNSKQRVEAWLGESFLPPIERRSFSQNNNAFVPLEQRFASANNLKLPNIKSADQKKKIFPHKVAINDKNLFVIGTQKPLHMRLSSGISDSKHR
jgi:hypothetical protein